MVRVADYDHDSEENLVQIAPRPWGWKTAAATATSVALLLAGAATLSEKSVPLVGGGVEDATQLAETMAYEPPGMSCSKVKDNCLSTGCCEVTGYKCFKTAAKPGEGKCMKKCTTAGCTAVEPHQVQVKEWAGLSFFCFSLVTANTGSTKPSFELDIMREQYRLGASIFQCAEQAVYSDKVSEIGPGYSTILVEEDPARKDWHFAKRKLNGCWVNTGIFISVWKKIGEEQKWARHNYVIKVDVDAVFFPHKLYTKLDGKGVPEEGVYYENCKYVENGYFGNLEVMSKNAFGVLLANLDTCYTELPWKVGIKNGKYGPMGEDLFAQQCMDLHNVKKVQDFELTLDGACPADRPKDQRKNKKFVPTCEGSTAATVHPLKKTAAWVKCWEAASA